jgi:RNA polymerase sigma factor (TIGR02999 family)
MLVFGMSDVTRILEQIEAGDPSAAEQLLPLVYDELRKLAAAKMAGESPDHTLQATALVHEAYLRLVDSDQVRDWNSRGHFFGAAAEAMRRILIERARKKQAFGHALHSGRVNIRGAEEVAPEDPEELLALNDALSRLEGEDPLAADLVKLRFFAGLTMAQAAAALGIPLRTAERNWTYARTWLHRALSVGKH